MSAERSFCAPQGSERIDRKSSRRDAMFSPVRCARYRTAQLELQSQHVARSARPPAFARGTLKKVPVAEEAWSVGSTERITVRTPTAGAMRKIHGECHQEHHPDGN